jgi:hypothetical protein
VVEAVGRPETWALAAGLARPGGEVLLHGGCPPGSSVTLPTGPLHYQELTLRGSYHHTPEAVRAALALLVEGTLPFGELLGPPLALTGYVLLPVAWALGVLSLGFLISFFLVAVLLGQLLSISALALEEFSFRRHPHGREIVRMLVYAAVENLGYRQLSDVWRGLAFWDLVRRRRAWGEMTRRGFQTAPTDQAGATAARRAAR